MLDGSIGYAEYFRWFLLVDVGREAERRRFSSTLATHPVMVDQMVQIYDVKRRDIMVCTTKCEAPHALNSPGAFRDD
jgi:hypothetical protein